MVAVPNSLVKYEGDSSSARWRAPLFPPALRVDANWRLVARQTPNPRQSLATIACRVRCGAFHYFPGLFSTRGTLRDLVLAYAALLVLPTHLQHGELQLSMQMKHRYFASSVLCGIPFSCRDCANSQEFHSVSLFLQRRVAPPAHLVPSQLWCKNTSKDDERLAGL